MHGYEEQTAAALPVQPGVALMIANGVKSDVDVRYKLEPDMKARADALLPGTESIEDAYCPIRANGVLLVEPCIV